MRRSKTENKSELIRKPGVRHKDRDTNSRHAELDQRTDQCEHQTTAVLRQAEALRDQAMTPAHDLGKRLHEATDTAYRFSKTAIQTKKKPGLFSCCYPQPQSESDDPLLIYSPAPAGMLF